MPTVEQSILIDAAPNAVWDVLTQDRYVRRWAHEFMPGIHAETDWKVGGPVVWKDDSDNPGMNGRVLAFEPGHRLEMGFQAKDNPGSPMGGDFVETYELEPDGGRTRLSITCGPLEQNDFDMVSGPWTRALQVMKDLAEGGQVADHAPRAGEGSQDTAPA